MKLTDSRGYSTEKNVSITVADYKKPSVVIESVTRCDSSGEADDDGGHLSVSFTRSFSTVRSKNASTLRLKYKSKTSSEYSASTVITSSPAIIGGDILKNLSYDLSVSISALVTTTPTETLISISTADIPFNIKSGGNAASFGRYSETDNLLDVGWNERIRGDLTVDGMLNTTVLPITASEDVASVSGRAFVFPCLKLGYLRMRVKLSSPLSANDLLEVCSVDGARPLIACALSGYASGPCGVHITNNGTVRILSPKQLSTDGYVYINGVWYTE